MRQDRRWELFECQRCGKCCVEIGLPYDHLRIHEIATFLALSLDEVIEQYYGKIIEKDNSKYWESEDHKRTPCPFLETEGDVTICSIYPVRPDGCRLYPFDTDFGRDGVDCSAADIVYTKLREEQSNL